MPPRPAAPLIAAFALLSACAGDAKNNAQQADDTGSARCATTFRYSHPAEADPIDGLGVAGAWNGWDGRESPLTEVAPGEWEGQVELAPGPHPYDLVAILDWSVADAEVSFCDPAADFVHCEDGYKEPWDNGWQHSCAPGATSTCQSLVVVSDCALPAVALQAVDRSGAASGAVQLELSATPGADEITELQVTLDDEPLSAQLSGGRATLSLSGLTGPRHSLRAVAIDAAGRQSAPLYVPLWLDQGAADTDRAQWMSGPIYFAFLDRLANGDPGNDRSEGATLPIGDYQGGDLAGLRNMLPYLDDLGVKTLWLSNLQDNAAGGWAGDCDETYAGYHAYWPSAARSIEGHFGDDAELRALIAEAHDRGMRVVMDWVANHVHETHPYAAAHPDWFHAQAICKDSARGQQNWDRIPEECWFAPYLPDIDYGQPDAMQAMVDDALWWVKTYGLDGLRVDAVKHMPHSVVWNLEQRVRAEVEHQGLGLGVEFWTVGETFDGADRIAAYISREGRPQLDGQFDFPLFFAIDSVYAQGGGSMRDIAGAVTGGETTWGPAALMSSFLGNHDVSRFTTKGTEGGTPACGEDGVVRAALPPSDPWVYRRMKLGWTTIFATSAVPLIYYGDELGLPGYTDPDNRQPLWWITGDEAGETATVAELAARVGGEPAEVLRHVAALSAARRAHPAMGAYGLTEWWLDDNTWGFVREQDGDQVLIVINRGAETTLNNGLSFAGLPTGVAYEDLLTGERFTATGDNLSLRMPAVSSRVLVAR